jgi:hypothetical protein
MTKTLTKYPTADRARLEAQKDRDDYERYKQSGFLTVIWRLVVENPELKWAYIIVVLGCIGSGESAHTINRPYYLLTFPSCRVPRPGHPDGQDDGRLHPYRQGHG